MTLGPIGDSATGEPEPGNRDRWFSWGRQAIVAWPKAEQNDAWAFNSKITVAGHNRFVNVTNHYFRYTPRPHKGPPSPGQDLRPGAG